MKLYKHLALISIAAVFFVLFSGSGVLAQTNHQQQCKWNSTQARVQKNISEPWQQELQLSCEGQFNIGSFHNGTGEFANDTEFVITYPNGKMKTLQWWTSNGGKVKTTQNGEYKIIVRTKYQIGDQCDDLARVVVDCSEQLPTPSPAQSPSPNGECKYTSTQARVQKDKQNHWQESLSLGCFSSFNVGSFHDGTGQFASDTNLTVLANLVMPWKQEVQMEKEFENGDRIFAFFPGEYVLHVTTPGQSGPQCENKATATISCGDWFNIMSGWKAVSGTD